MRHHSRMAQAVFRKTLADENHHQKHYQPVHYYTEAHKGLPSPITCCGINQDESCGMQSIQSDINLEQMSLSSLFMYTEKQGFVVVIIFF